MTITFSVFSLYFFIFLITLPTAILSVEDKTSEEHIFKKYLKFNKKYDRHYSTFKEMQEKYVIFKDNYLSMLKQREGEEDIHVLGITAFMDMSNEEFNKKYRSVNVSEAKDIEGDIDIVDWDDNNAPFDSIQNEEEDKIRTLTEGEANNNAQNEVKVKSGLPEQFDYRDKGVVAKVIDQGACGSCWAFSALVAVEASYATKYRRLLNFSPQQILDCNESGSSCSGGTIVSSMRYLKTNGAISLSSYPYEERQRTCRYKAQSDVSKAPRVDKFFKGTDIKESVMQKMLYHGSPLAVNINSEYFKYYKKGILVPSSCKATVDHGVAIVGYGVSGKYPYWIIKNSWGPSFGEGGYIKLLRGKALCGINTTVVGAVVK